MKMTQMTQEQKAILKAIAKKYGNRLPYFFKLQFEDLCLLESAGGRYGELATEELNRREALLRDNRCPTEEIIAAYEVG